MPGAVALAVAKDGNGNVTFTYSQGGSSDILTISTLPAQNQGGLTAYSNALNATNQTKGKFGTRLILFKISDTANIAEINNGFLFINKISPNLSSGNSVISLDSRILIPGNDRVPLSFDESEIDGETGIVGTIMPPPNPGTPYIITHNIFQSYLGHKPKERRAADEWGDIYNLMTNAKGDTYITISRSTKLITDKAGNPVSLPYCLYGINDFDNNYNYLMQTQLAYLNSIV